MEQDKTATTETRVVKPALILDLDDTVRYSLSGEKFLQGPDDVGIFEGVAETIKAYRDKGYYIGAASNQGGVAWGKRSYETVMAEMNRTDDLLTEAPGQNLIDAYSMCPSMADATVFPYNYRSLGRKPDYGMLVQIEIYAFAQGVVIDWDNSLLVGDRPEDKLCAKNADIAFTWAWDFFPGRTAPDWLAQEPSPIGAPGLRTPCCGYEVRDGAVGPIYWNNIARVVKCHACGDIFLRVDEAIDKVTAAARGEQKGRNP